MKHTTPVVFLVLFLSACASPTLEPTPDVSTDTPAEPAVDPALPAIDALESVSLEGMADNRVQNAGFEQSIGSVDMTSDVVANNWLPFYCAPPFTTEACPAQRRGEGNPADLTMSKPVYTSMREPVRVLSGEKSQHWYCANIVCQAGVYQTVATQPGELCEVGAFVQSRSATAETGVDEEGQSTGIGRSDLADQSKRENSTWVIRVDLEGGGAPYEDDVLTSRVFGYDDGIYDQYAPIRYSFTATSERTTIFYENARLWPFPFNDNFIDEAYVRCVSPQALAEALDAGNLSEPPQAAEVAAPEDEAGGIDLSQVEVSQFVEVIPGEGTGYELRQLEWQVPGAGPDDIIKVDGTYYFYYVSAPTDEGGSSIGVATSTDGLTWESSIEQPVLSPRPDAWDNRFVFSPTVIYDDEDQLFKMWYVSRDEKRGNGFYAQGFGYAESADGFNWDFRSDTPVVQHGQGGAWDEERIGGLDVIKVDGQYIMYYTASSFIPTGIRRSIGCRISVDGLNWSYCPDNPIFEPNPDVAPFEGVEVEEPNVVYANGQYLMAYTGFLGPQGDFFRIGMAWSPDGLRWERLAVPDPIVQPDARESNTFSPALFLDDDGTLYLWYGTDITGEWTVLVREAP